MTERRTLIRRRADSASAGVLRGEVPPWAGEIVNPHPGHERYEPFCADCADEAWRDSPLRQREAAEDRTDLEAKGLLR